MLWCHMKDHQMLNKMHSLMWRNGLLLESDQHARIKLSAKFKKILCSRFIATITIYKLVALNPLQIIFLNLAESFVLAC